MLNRFAGESKRDYEAGSTQWTRLEDRGKRLLDLPALTIGEPVSVSEKACLQFALISVHS